MLGRALPPAFQTLNHLARRYAKTEADAARLSELAFQVLVNNPSLFDGPNFDRAMFRIVHRIAHNYYRSQIP